MPKTITQLSSGTATANAVVAADNAAGTLTEKITLGSIAALGGGAPADGSVTDAKITSGGLSTSVLNWAAIAAWQPNTAYAKGDLVSFNGIAYRRAVAGTSGATFNSANWQATTPSTFLASQVASGTLDDARLSDKVMSATNLFLWSMNR